MTSQLTYIQLKLARNILDLGVRDIGSLLNLSKSTINKAELGKTRDFFYKNSAFLIDFFGQHDITFPTPYSIRLDTECKGNVVRSPLNKCITKFQLKTARLILSYNQSNLALCLNTSKGVISRLELLENNYYINPRNTSLIDSIDSFFLQRGIDFVDPLYVFYKKYIDISSSRR